MLVSPHAGPGLNDELGDELSAWLTLTQRCDLRCAYCYIPPRPANLAPETARAVVQTVLRAARAQHVARVKLK